MADRFSELLLDLEYAEGRSTFLNLQIGKIIGAIPPDTEYLVGTIADVEQAIWRNDVELR